MPALAMTVPIWVMPCSDCRVCTASKESFSTVLSSLTVISLLEWPVGSLERSFVEGLEGSRTVAMTVVFGRERIMAVRALPMPGGELC